VKVKGGSSGSGGWFTVRKRIPANARQCEYTLPCNFGYRQARIYVRALDDTLSDYSDAPFDIGWPSVGELDSELRELYAHSDYFRSNPRIARMTVESFDRITLYNFCSCLANLENIGEMDIREPLELRDCVEPDPCTSIELTDSEFKMIFAAKAAHAIWLDKHDLVPWHLLDYTDDELEGLFTPEKLFNGSDAVGYSFYGIVDHSPSEAYGYVLEQGLLRDTRINTLYAVLDDVRGAGSLPSFYHGSASYGDPTTARTLYEALTGLSTRGAREVRISRKGCHTMARIVVGILRAVNIPGETTTSGEWYEVAHCTAVWPVLSRVMPHGDDVYSATLREVPVAEFLPTFDIYSHPDYTSVCGTSKPCISKRHRALLAISYPAQWMRERCCHPERYDYTSCSDYIHSEYSTYLTEAEMTEAVVRISGLCE